MSTRHWNSRQGNNHPHLLGGPGETVEVHTDGSIHHGDTRKGGGWAWVCRASGEWDAGGTLRRDALNSGDMEARAVLEVLRIVHPKARLIVLTDCEELVKAYRSGLSGERVPERWVRPINKLVKASRGREVTLQWVKGHERCIPNRIADRLAYHAMSYTREGQRLDFFRLARIVHQVETRLEATLREEQAAA